MPEVRVVNVTKKYDNIVANQKISLTIKDGEYVSIIGPSGCGKTTLIKNIAGIIQPDEGEIYIDGKVVNDVPIERRGIGYVFQDIALFPHMNVWKNITYGPNVMGLSKRETRILAFEMLDMIKMNERIGDFPSQLSGGSQQKCAVARALMTKAELLLLDEPLGALDIKVRTKLRYELRRLVKDLGLTAIHVTHDQEEAMSISDRVLVMRKGRLVESGSPLDLYMKPKNLFTANFVGEANFLTGIVTGKTEEKITVEIEGNIFLEASDKQVKKGDRVVVTFRPEFTSIDKVKDVNSLSGRVQNILYSGNIIRIGIKLDNGELVILKKIFSFGDPEFKVEDKITFKILSKDILIYPYPTKGLLKELSLE